MTAVTCEFINGITYVSETFSLGSVISMCTLSGTDGK